MKQHKLQLLKFQPDDVSDSRIKSEKCFDLRDVPEHCRRNQSSKLKAQ